jgi:hypothetical protein
MCQNQTQALRECSEVVAVNLDRLNRKRVESRRLDMAVSSADNRGGLSFAIRNALSRNRAVRVGDYARGKLCTDLLDLAPRATSIINKNDGTPIHHRRFLFERRLSIAEGVCGEEQSQGR